MRFTLALLAVLALPVLAGPPDDASIDAWIRALADEDTVKRDEAEKRLLEAGGAALPKVRAELGREGPHDAEAAARLKRIVAAAERAAWWARAWAESPLELAREFVKEERCGLCGRAPYEVTEVTHEGLAKRFPDVKFFVLDWICCQDKPMATRVLAAGKAVDAFAEVGGGGGWAAKMAPLVPAVKTAEEARETASLLLSLSEQPTRFDEKVIVDGARGSASEEEGRFVARVPMHGRKGLPEWVVTFAKDGTLESAEWKER
ncbi:MAG: hypothetical protein IT452_03210 [Planctomycetia bacterium]|nr:hypothetical protein [Planctomycetia bacterium]